MEGTVRLRQLVCSLEGGDDGAVQESVEFIRQLQGERASQAHSVLCAAMLKAGEGEGGGGRSLGDKAELLHELGPAQALSVVYSNARHVSGVVVQWLAGKVLHLLSSGRLVEVMVAECREVSGARLTAQQEHLVGILCRLPDILSNCLRQHLDPRLLPRPYFSQLGADVFSCLQQVHSILRASGDCSLLFPAAMVGKAALLGQKDAVFSQLVPSLECCAEHDHLWRRLAQTLFARIPGSCLEPVLDAVLHYCSPSLLPMCPLRWLLGDLVPSSQRGSFLLTHKLPLMKVPSSPHAVFTLVGYLAGCSEGEEDGVLGKTLQSVLGVWSDASALRHMDLRQHLWLSRVTVLGVACLSAGQRARLKPVLQRLVMAGLQVHLDSPLQERRHVGMAVGEGVMACLNPSDKLQLKFEYEPSEEVRAIQQLARPVVEQEKELRTRWGKEKKELQGGQEKAGDRVGQEKRREDRTVERKEEQSKMVPPQPTREQFGEGFVQTRECSDTDSDDDLVPYAMEDDPDSTQPKQPRYLRTLIQVLVSGDAPQQQGALRVAESLVLTCPPDLNEVCVELARVLLHLTDSYGLSDFASLRHKALVALAVTCPSPTAHYLTSEFYGPNYTLRQRMDILEVLSSAALELAQPGSSDNGDSSDGVRDVRGERGTKPWEEVIRQRLRAKTRIISKGPSKPPSVPSPNRFAPVAPTFFFPLMAAFDCPVATLDLLGQDSLLLGSLLHTLGTVMYCATNAPLAPTMAAALLDFLWALRYHNEAYVRQGVLFALSMLVASTPILPTGLEGGLTETVHWVEGVHQSDPDAQCRSLARQTLALLGASVQQTIGQQ